MKNMTQENKMTTFTAYMNENELREWMERLAETFHTTDNENWKAEDVGTNCTDAYITGCCDGEIHLAREILRKFFK